MVIKLFGYYINVFKANKKTTVSPAWQVRRSCNYLHLCDPEGRNIPVQTDMILKNPLDAHSSCIVEFLVDLNHLDEEPIAWSFEDRKPTGSRAPDNNPIPRSL